MNFGVQVRATAETVDLRIVARELEARGFESLFLPEHTHVPVRRTSVHPGGDDLMDAAMRGFDPFVALAAAAAVTTRLRIGTGVCLLPQHDPIVLAKQISTLDQISGGRFLFGIGAGWAIEEMANHGVNPTRRWAITREKALAMRAIWTQNEAEFAGEFVCFEPIFQWPKPAQQPHPPILIGGEGTRALDRVLDYGDGWFPNWESDTPDRVRELHHRADAENAGPRSVTVYSAPKNRAAVDACIAAGVDRICFDLPCADAAELERSLSDLTSVTATAP